MMIINQPKEDHFKLGLLVVTNLVTVWADRTLKNHRDLDKCLKKYCEKDWGDADEEDKKLTNAAINNGGRIMGVYKNVGSEATDDVRDLWIITECDRSVTTILFPEEY